MFKQLSFGVLAVVTGCTGSDAKDTNVDSGTDVPAESLSIVGEYVDDFGTEHTITDDVWTQTYPGYDPSTYAIETFGADWLVAQNGDENSYSAGLWSRFDWLDDPMGLYYCQTAYDAASAEEAEAATPADRSDLEAGCGGFPFSNLMSQ
jgi:hypothetical protein